MKNKQVAFAMRMESLISLLDINMILTDHRTDDRAKLNEIKVICYKWTRILQDRTKPKPEKPAEGVIIL